MGATLGKDGHNTRQKWALHYSKVGTKPGKMDSALGKIGTIHKAYSTSIAKINTILKKMSAAQWVQLRAKMVIAMGKVNTKMAKLVLYLVNQEPLLTRGNMSTLHVLQ